MQEVTLCSTPGNTILYMHLIQDNQFRMDYHLHDRFEIYFLVSGKVEFFVERNIYIVEPGDLLVVNNYEIHKTLLKSDTDYERIIIELDPAVLSPFCMSDYNLLRCFTQRPKGVGNRVTLNAGQLEKLKKLHGRFEALADSKQDGADLLKLTCLIELLVLVNNAFQENGKSEKGMKVPAKVLPILDYIDNNLDESLTLQSLSARFFIDKHYLSRLFLKSTGINIHDYILSRRIFRAKTLLREGKSILEASQSSGFENYSTFIRSFKKLVGTLPRDYQKNIG